jgi:hypothetical protein
MTSYRPAGQPRSLDGFWGDQARRSYPPQLPWGSLLAWAPWCRVHGPFAPVQGGKATLEPCRVGPLRCL